MTLSVPRDRAGTFDPKLIAKYQRRFPDFDEKIISMYARGMTVREIRGHLEELYGIDVSPDLISAVTDAVLDEVAEWQNRPLDICYPLVFFDAIRVKVRDEGFVRNKAIYIALGILPDGTKEILGIWIEQTEGAKFWLRVMNELKNRGARGHSDRRRRWPEGLSRGDQCRFSADQCSDLHRSPDPPFAWTLPPGRIARAWRRRCGRSIAQPTPTPARPRSRLSRKVHGATNIRRSRRAGGATGNSVIPFFAFPEGVRRIIYTTNAIEALNSKLRRAVRTRGHFPSDDAALEAAISGLEPRRRGMETTAARVGRGEDAVRRHVQRAVHDDVMKPAHTEILTVPQLASLEQRNRRVRYCCANQQALTHQATVLTVYSDPGSQQKIHLLLPII